MKKAIVKFLFRLAIMIALWAMNDKTKAKISQSAAEKIGELYRKMKQRLGEQEESSPQPAPKEENAQGDNAQQGPFSRIRGLIRRLTGTIRGAGSDSDFEL